MHNLSLAEARRIALSAQGFAAKRPGGRIDQRHLRSVLERTALFQIDSVNVLARAHYLPLFSRIGAYPRAVLEAAAWGKPRSLFEYWAHEASLLPLALQPFLRWRMERAERGEGGWGQTRPFAKERREEALAIEARIRSEGPMAASDFETEKGPGGWWGWSDTKSALEWLFWSGRITTKTRRGNFERVYDLTERVLPAEIMATPTPDPQDAHRHLLRTAAKSLGIATSGELRDYFRQSPLDAKPRIAELVEEGALIPVQVQGWSQEAYLDADAAWPRRIRAQALLAPFDPMVWERSRTERLFGVRYRIEIYTPAHKRTHGYYVLPFLLGERLAARVDLKADRAAGVLQVLSAHPEPDAPAELAERLGQELALMTAWLGLETYRVAAKGGLSQRLAEVRP